MIDTQEILSSFSSSHENMAILGLEVDPVDEEMCSDVGQFSNGAIESFAPEVQTSFKELQKEHASVEKETRKLIRKIRKKGRKKYRLLFFLAGLVLLAVLTFTGVLTTKEQEVEYKFSPGKGATALRMLSVNTSSNSQRNCTAIQDTALEKIAYPTSIYDTLNSDSRNQLSSDKNNFCWCETTSVALNGSKVDEISTYPKDMFTMEEKRSGAILLHVILMLYCFYGLAEM